MSMTKETKYTNYNGRGRIVISKKYIMFRQPGRMIAPAHVTSPNSNPKGRVRVENCDQLLRSYNGKVTLALSNSSNMPRRVR
jgi:hypothetical protein